MIALNWAAGGEYDSQNFEQGYITSQGLKL
jgi:hypothetical protein